MLPPLHLPSTPQAVAHRNAAHRAGGAQAAAAAQPAGPAGTAGAAGAAGAAGVAGVAAAGLAASIQTILQGTDLDDSAIDSPVADEVGTRGLRVGEQIGVGRRCLVFAANFQGDEVVVKRYRADAIAKHAELTELPLAEFEFRRNQACYAIPGMTRHVARPFGYYVGPGVQWLVQQRLHGELCSDAGAGWSDLQWRAMRDRLLELVRLVHQAGLYDLDLHPGNVMLTQAAGESLPVLFDFNLVPFTERRRLTLDGWLFRFGLVDARYRDLRRLRKRFR